MQLLHSSGYDIFASYARQVRQLENGLRGKKTASFQACLIAWVISFLAVIPMFMRTEYNGHDESCEIKWEDDPNQTCIPINPEQEMEASSDDSMIGFFDEISIETSSNPCSCKSPTSYKQVIIGHYFALQDFN